MFDFEKLDIYKKAKKFYSANLGLIRGHNLDRIIENQLSRASLSVVLNISEGTGRFGRADKARFYTISRSSIFECIAILDVLKEEGLIEKNTYDAFYEKGEELSRILFSMIKNLKNNK